MPVYLQQVAYSPEGWEALVKKPQDRIEAVRPAIEKLGGKIVNTWFAFGVQLARNKFERALGSLVTVEYERPVRFCAFAGLPNPSICFNLRAPHHNTRSFNNFHLIPPAAIVAARVRDICFILSTTAHLSAALPR